MIKTVYVGTIAFQGTDAQIDKILAERAAIEAKRFKLAPRPSKDGDDK